MSDAPVRIAMWSGPRNISTAMMRSWGSRPDTFVTDEPLYAHYLEATGVDHPARDEVIAAHEIDWRKVVAWLTGPVPGGPGESHTVWFQKHMTHHMLPDIDRAWLWRPEFRHAFLIRDPAEMLVSLVKVTPNPTVSDTGLPQQIELFEEARRRLSGGRVPPVVDAADVLREPRRMLAALCRALGVPFDERMLTWERGRRKTDGVWAEHWYGVVERSTGFGPYVPRRERPPERLAALLDECQGYYERMHRERLKP
ncbi:MAG: HAD family hydrolase [Phycisphaerales bacterium]